MNAGISDYTSGLHALVLMPYVRAEYGPAEEAGWCQVPAHLWLHWVCIAACELSLVAASGGYCPVALHRLLISEACIVAEHGLSSTRGFGSCGVSMQLMGSRAQAQ